MNCSACGRENRAGAAFCAGCGERLVRACPACAAELAGDARFCDACGTPVDGPAVEPVPAGDRKVVSIVFADLSGSTSLQERLDAEATARLMAQVQATLTEAVEAHAGRVVKSTGDGVMAVFGVPVLREDDAVRAVRAGVAMQEAFAGLGIPEVSLRVGVNTGEVVVSPDSDDVVGDPVNVAARLEAAAGLGEVLVGPETQRLVRDVVALERVEPLVLRGKAEPVPAARVVSASTTAVASVTPFLGRDDDLAALVAALDEAIATTSTRLVTVLGWPGLGKSRLAAELVARVAERAAVVEVRFVADAGSSFGPIADALRRVVDDELELSGSTEQVFWTIRRAVEGIAGDRPVVVVLDDLHWAEPAMLDLVEHLAEWLRDAPVLLLALARPELRERRPSLLDATGPSSAVVVLGGLDADACRSLALEVLGAESLPEGVLARALDASEGNPLFLRELLRLLVDDGVLVRRDDGRWSLTVEVEAIQLPATIHAALAARIEQLQPDERSVLQAASIIGRHFARGAVAALLPSSVAGRLDEHLSSLHRRALVDPEGTWWDDERMFRFHHVLIRDAAYRRVLKEVRADQHVRYADWLVARIGEVTIEHDDVLGFHLEQALTYRRELGEPVDPIVVTRAVAHLAAAGRRALDGDDLATAAALLGRALVLSPGDADLLRDRCEALVSGGDVHAALSAVASLAEVASDDRSRAMADVFDAQLAGQRTPEALRDVAARASASAAVLAAHGDDVGVAHAEAVHASALAGLGQIAACEGALDRSLAAARRAGDTRRANVVLSIAPAAALWGPSPIARASGRCLDVVRVLRITSWAPHVEAHALRHQAVLEAMRDRADAARRMLATARQTFTDLGHRLGLLDTSMFDGLVELLDGRPAAAEEPLRVAVAGFEAMGAGRNGARAIGLLVRALLELDRVDEALELAEPALGGDDTKASIAILGVRAEALVRRGALEEAEELARRAVSLGEPTDLLVDHADARLVLARVLLAAGRRSEAHAELARARSLYEQKGATVGVRRCGEATTAASPIATAAGAPSPSSTSSEPSNAAVRVARRFYDHLNAGGVVDERICAPGYVVDDHTTHLVEDMAAMSESMRVAGVGRSSRIDVEAVVATLGDRWAVLRTRWHGRVAPEVAAMEKLHLAVTAVTEDGRLESTHLFDVDDEAGAFLCANALATRSRRRPPDTLATRAIARYIAAARSGDPDAVAAQYAPGVVVEHHSLHVELSREYSRHMDEAIQRGDPLSVSVLAALGDRHSLSRQVIRNPAASNELAMLVVERVDDLGRSLRVDVFDEDALGRSMACLFQRWSEEELDGGDGAVGWRIAQACLAPERAAEGDWDSYRAAFADDAVFVDHRSPGHTFRGSDAITAWQQAGFAAAPDVHVRITDVLALTPERSLIELSASGTTTEGSAFHDVMWLVTFFDGGGIHRCERFEPEQLDEAWACFDRIPPTRRVRPNEATAVIDRWRAGFDRAGPAAMFSDDFVSIDHVLHTTASLDDHLGTYWELVDRGGTFSVEEVIATLGERQALAPLVIQFPVADDGAPATRVRLYLATVDGGRFRRFDQFAPEDLAAALGCLYERWAEEELSGAARERAMQISRFWSYGELVAARDWEGYGDVAGIDAVQVDHRPIGAGEIRGRSAIVAWIRELSEASEELRADVIDVLALTPRAALVTNVASGVAAGGAYRIPAHVALAFGPDGRMTRTEFFPEDALVDAWACFDRLDRPGRGRLVVPNLATATAARWLAAARAGDVETSEALHAPGYEYRHHAMHTTIGWDDYFETERGYAGHAAMACDPIATLGERHGLFRHHVSWDREGDVGAADVEYLAVSRVGVDGRSLYDDIFPADALPAAMQSLVERWAEDELSGDDQARTRRSATFFGIDRFCNAQDWQAFTALFDPAVVLTDHRGNGIVGHGPQAIVDWLRELVGPLDWFHTEMTDVLALSPDAVLAARSTVGARDGGDIDWSSLNVIRFGPSGLADRVHFLSPDALDTAWELYDTHSRPVRRRHAPPNLASTAFDAGLDALDRGGAEITAEPSRLAVFEDPAAPPTPGPVFIADIGRMIAAGVTWDGQLLSTLGERHALYRLDIHWPGDAGSGPVERPRFVVVRAAVDGVLEQLDLFEENQLTGALGCLYERWAEAERPEIEWRRVGVLRARQIARATGDWGPLRAAYTPDVVFVHHESALPPIVGPDALVEWFRSTDDLADEMTSRLVDVHATTPRTVLQTIEVSGVRDGGVFAQRSFNVAAFAPDGRVRRVEAFPPEQEDEAWACFDRFDAVPPPRRVRHNTCTRGFDTWLASVRRGDLSGAEAWRAPGFVYVDHSLRVALSHDDQVRRQGRRAPSSVIAELLATAGERHALHRFHIEHAADDQPAIVFDLLLVNRVDASGRSVSTDAFAADELVPALQCLIERWAEDELPSVDRASALAWAETLDTAAEVTVGDWEGYVAHFDDDVIVIDHRLAGAGELRGTDALVRWMQGIDPEGSITVDYVDVLAHERHRALLRARVDGGRDGGRFELHSLLVICAGPDGRIGRFELFAPEELDAAWQRWDALGTTPGVVDNAATGSIRRWQAIVHERDLDAMRAVHAPTFTSHDHVMRATTGLAEHLESIASMFERGVEFAVTEFIDTRGDRLALTRLEVRWPESHTAGTIERPRLYVTEVDELGRFLRFDHVADGDLDAARRILDERAAALASPRRVVVPNLATRMVERWRATMESGGDPDALKAPGYRLVQHEQHIVVERQENRAEEVSLAGRTRVTTDVLAALGDRHSLTRVVLQVAGDDVEYVLLDVARVDAAGFGLLDESFAPDDLAEAVATLFERWGEAELDERGAARARAIAGSARVGRVLREQDWDGFRALYADDVVSIDHRPTAAGELRGFATFLAWQRAFFEQVDPGGIDLRLTDVLMMTPRVSLVRWHNRGRMRDGAPFETEFLCVAHYGADGRMDHLEYFAVDRLDDAFVCAARLDAAADSQPRRRVPETFATRIAARYDACFRAGDLDGLRAFTSPDFVSWSHVMHAAISREAHLALEEDVLRTGRWLGLEVLAALGERHALIRGRFRWRSDDGAESEAERFTVARIDERGLIVRQDSFAPDDFDNAVVCLVERWAEGELDTHERSRAEAMIRFVRINEHVAHQDWSAWGASWEEDAVLFDHRPSAAGEIRGRSAITTWLSGFAATAGVVDARFADVHALTPSFAVLQEQSQGQANGVEWQMAPLLACRFGADGLVAEGHIFEAEQLDHALALADRWDTEADAGRETVRRTGVTRRRLEENAATRALRRWVEVTRAGDVAAMDATHAPSYVVHHDEHHVTVTVHEGRDSEHSLAGNRTVDATALAALGERHALHRLGFQVTEGDVTGDIDMLLVTRTDRDGRTVRDDTFAPEALDGALECLTRRWAEDELEDPIERARGDELARGWRTSAAITAQDWRAYRTMLDDDAVVIDHRVGGIGEVAGADDVVRWSRALVEQCNRFQTRAIDVLAFTPRAAVLVALSSGVAEGGPFELPLLTVSSRSAGGRTARIELFALDDEAAAWEAFERLDAIIPPRRDVRTIERPPVPLPTAIVRLFHAFEGDDGADLRSVFAPDAVIVDHRPSGWGEKDRDGYLDLARSLRELSPDSRIHVPEWLRIEPWGATSLMVVRGRSTYDADYEDAFYRTMIVRGDQIVRSELFPVDQREAALAVLGARRPTDVAENVAVRLHRRFFEAVLGGDVDAALTITPPDGVSHDRRRVVGTGVAVGPEPMRASVDAMLAVGLDGVDTTVIATRGEHLALSRVMFHLGADTVEVLMVIEASSTLDTVVAAIVFDSDDVDVAFEELDRRNVALAGDLAGVILAGLRFVDAHNRRDLHALRAAFTPDAVCVDHRPASFGSMSVDAMLSLEADLFAATERSVHRPLAWAALEPWGAVSLVTRAGLSHDGSEFDFTLWAVTIVAGDRLARVELFPEDARGAAVACLVALNPTRHLLMEMIDAHNARDVARYRSLVADDATLTNHKPGAVWTTVTIDEFIALSEALWSMTVGDASLEIVRVDLDRSLYHVFTDGEAADSGGPFEISSWCVAQVRDGLVVSVDVWDLEQRAEAEAFYDQLAATSPPSTPR